MQEELQTTIARELHDEFGQILTALGTMLGRIKAREERRLPAESRGPEADSLTTDLEEVRALAQRTLDRIRTQSRMLHPVILDDFGLQQAVAWYVGEFARQHGIEALFEPAGELGTLPPETTIHLYRIVQEALTNVARHAQAGRVVVRLSRSGAAVALDVEDDGVGLSGEAATMKGSAAGGIGITSMRERAELMGGTLSLGRAPGGGLTVAVRVPVG
jgi:signal transduction histidine kinase